MQNLIAETDMPFNLATETTQDGARIQRELDDIQQGQLDQALAQLDLFADKPVKGRSRPVTGFQG